MIDLQVQRLRGFHDTLQFCRHFEVRQKSIHECLKIQSLQPLRRLGHLFRLSKTTCQSLQVLSWPCSAYGTTTAHRLDVTLTWADHGTLAALEVQRGAPRCQPLNGRTRHHSDFTVPRSCHLAPPIGRPAAYRFDECLANLGGESVDLQKPEPHVSNHEVYRMSGDFQRMLLAMRTEPVVVQPCKTIIGPPILQPKQYAQIPHVLPSKSCPCPTSSQPVKQSHGSPSKDALLHPRCAGGRRSAFLVGSGYQCGRIMTTIPIYNVFAQADLSRSLIYANCERDGS